MPKFIADILAISAAEMQEAGIDYEVIKKGFQRESSGWQKVEDPTDLRVVWLAYKALSAKYKALVDKAFGNVEALAKARLEEEATGALAAVARAKYEHADFDYFRYTRKQEQGTAAGLASSASWLRVLCAENRGDIDAYGLKGIEKKADLLLAVHTALQDAPPVGLQVAGRILSMPRLGEKARQFKKALRKGRAEALDLLLGGHVGNKNSAKLIWEDQHSLLRQLYGRHNAFNYQAILDDYNSVAQQKGWPTITRNTVANWCKRYHKQVAALRTGMGEYKGAIDFVVKGSRPSAPLFRIESDGTPIELYFKKVVKTKAGNDALNPWGRLVGVVVLDTFNDYPLGYALGETESADLIRAAYRNAVAHIKELTGAYYLPWQIKADHFAEKQMGEMYMALAMYKEVFATVGNAREKAIESWFGRAKEKHLAKYPNFSGYNITAKREQPNRQYLAKISAGFPEEDGLRAQFAQFIADVRGEVAEGKTKQERWLEAFNALPEAERRPCDRTKYLDVLGAQTGYTNRLTNRGIEVTLLGQKRTYMLLDHGFYAHLGADYSIKFDEQDMSTVLAVGEGGIYLLNQTLAVPMAMKDMTEEDRKNLQRQLAFKGREKRLTMIRNAQDMERIADLATDADSASLLKDAFAGKHLQQEAENLLKAAHAPSKKQTKAIESDASDADDMDLWEGFSPSDYLKNSEYNF